MLNHKHLLKRYWYRYFIINGLSILKPLSSLQLFRTLKGMSLKLSRKWLLLFEGHFHLNSALEVRERSVDLYNAHWKAMLNKYLNKSYNLKYAESRLHRLLMLKSLFFQLRRGKRYLFGYPFEGQKTRSNAKTAKKFRAPLFLVKFFQKKKVIIKSEKHLTKRIRALRRKLSSETRKESLKKLEFWFKL